MGLSNRSNGITLFLLGGFILILVTLSAVQPFINNLWSIRSSQSILTHSQDTLPPAHPNHQRGSLWLGKFRLQQGAVDEAIIALEEQKNSYPDDPFAQLLLGDAYKKNNLVSFAIAEWLSIPVAARLETAGWEAYTGRHWDDAYAYFEALWSLDPVDGTFGLANVLFYGLEDVERAEVLLRQSIDRYPESAENTKWEILLGELLLSENRNYEATVVFQDVVSQYPTEAKGYVGLGKALYQTADFEAARATLEKGIDLSPENPTGYIALADVLFFEKRYSEAEALYTQALELAPDNTWYLIQQATNVREAGDFQRALSLYQNVLDRRVTSMTAVQLGAVYCSLAITYHKVGDTENALTSSAQFLSNESSDPFCWITVGRVYESVNDKNLAVQAYQKALEIDPNNSSAIELLNQINQ